MWKMALYYVFPVLSLSGYHVYKEKKIDPNASFTEMFSPFKRPSPARSNLKPFGAISPAKDGENLTIYSDQNGSSPAIVIDHGSGDIHFKTPSVGCPVIAVNGEKILDDRCAWNGESDGLIGPPGPPGDKGERGDSGPRGNKGERGDSGPRGNKGEKGEEGEEGDSNCPHGDKGRKGPQGDIGYPRECYYETGKAEIGENGKYYYKSSYSREYYFKDNQEDGVKFGPRHGYMLMGYGYKCESDRYRRENPGIKIYWGSGSLYEGPENIPNFGGHHSINLTCANQENAVIIALWCHIFYKG